MRTLLFMAILIALVFVEPAESVRRPPWAPPPNVQVEPDLDLGRMVETRVTLIQCRRRPHECPVRPDPHPSSRRRP